MEVMRDSLMRMSTQGSAAVTKANRMLGILRKRFENKVRGKATLGTLCAVLVSYLKKDIAEQKKRFSWGQPKLSVLDPLLYEGMLNCLGLFSKKTTTTTTKGRDDRDI